MLGFSASRFDLVCQVWLTRLKNYRNLTSICKVLLYKRNPFSFNLRRLFESNLAINNFDIGQYIVQNTPYELPHFH